jgi:YD repeat-containing protein
VPRVSSSRVVVILTALLFVIELVLSAEPAWASSTTPRPSAKSSSADIQPRPIGQPSAATTSSPTANLTHPIAAGSNHSFAVKSDGTVWTWGDSCVGQPGNGTNTGTCYPGANPAQTTSFGSVASVAAASYHAVALRTDGTVWGWGDDEYGTVGAGGSGDVDCGSGPCVLRPVQAQTTGTFIAVGAGYLDSYALRSDGTAWAWGDNGNGELGIGTFTGPDTCYELGYPEQCSKTPVQVSGLTGVSAVAGGAYFSMALKSNGTVWTWGHGDEGELGNGTTGRSSTPVQVSNLSNAIAIAPLSGGSTAAALRGDGTVWTWGYGGDGELGNGTTGQINPTPVQVSNLGGVTAIAGGSGRFLALKADGTVWTWPSTDRHGNVIATPVQVNNLASVVAIAAGGGHSLAVKSDGTVWAWGSNNYGQLGDGTTTDRSTPVQSQMSGVPPPAPFVLPQQPLTGGAITGSETYGGNNQCYICSLARLAQGYVGKPVNTAFGNMTDSTGDIAIPGRGFPLNFLRTYNSLGAGANGPLGYGWSTNVLMSLSQPGGTGPVTITQEGGSQVVFNQSGSVYTPAAPRLVASLTHNGDGTWTFVRLAKETFTFSSAGLLTSEQDLNGYVTTFTYDGSNQLTTITDQSGRTLTIGWSGSHIASVTDGNVSPARTVAFQYNDGAGNLTDVIDVNGGHSHYAYDVSHRLTNMFDPTCYAAGASCNSGNGVVNVYDGSNRVTSQTDNLGRATTFVYTGDPTSSTGSTTTITDPKGNVRQETYQYGVRTGVTHGYGTPQAATWRYRFDPNTGALINVIDPNGNTTSYTVDGSGNWLTRTDPLGRATQRTYNAFNEPLTDSDPLGITTTNTYDNRGNLTQVSRPLLDGNGQVIATQATQYHYADPGHPGDLTSMLDADGKSWSYTYDTHGDRTSSADSPRQHAKLDIQRRRLAANHDCSAGQRHRL